MAVGGGLGAAAEVALVRQLEGWLRTDERVLLAWETSVVWGRHLGLSVQILVACSAIPFDLVSPWTLAVASSFIVLPIRSRPRLPWLERRLVLQMGWGHLFVGEVWWLLGLLLVGGRLPSESLP